MNAESARRNDVFRLFKGFKGSRQSVRRVLRKLYDRFLFPAKLSVLRLISRSGWASTLYYAIGSSAFRREHQAVLQGRVRYYDGQSGGHTDFYLLRRNVHRIEKGLIMRPRRKVFAADYIEPTTATYVQLASSMTNAASIPELGWAGDVLSEYFQCAGGHPAIDAARTLMPDRDRRSTEQKRAPFKCDAREPPPVAFKDLYALARRRRSVRWFEQREVPRSLIDRAMEVAVQAPSACNRQPYHFRIIDDPQLARRIASIPMGTVGFSDNVPAVAVLVGDLSAYFDERDRHVIYIDASLAAMSFLLALETLGLASCCINWPDIAEKERAIREALTFAPHERVIMLIAIGFPDPSGMIPYSQKRTLDAVRRYNE